MRGFLRVAGVAALASVLALCGLGAASASTRPAAWGRHKVVTETYDLGDRAFKLPSGLGKAELTGVVHHPEKLRGRHYPLVVFMHGLFDTCAGGGSEGTEWPCPKGGRPIPSYRGYDYIARRLASHGYVVVSISANGINAPDYGGPSKEAMTARGLLIQKHLDLWKAWATRGGKPFGRRFRSAIDFSRVGTMGHSRGGEGVVRHYEINAALGRPYGVRAVMPLDSSDFFRPVVTRAALATVLARCGANGNGVEYFDDARYRVPGDKGVKHTITVMGANHNFFNTVWTTGSGWPGAGDDWQGGRASACHPSRKTRLSAARQRDVAAAYVTGFFRYYVGGERVLAPMWRGSPLVSRQGPERRDINRLLGAAELRRNTLGGSVTTSGAVSAKLCGGPKHVTCLQRPGPRVSEPHQGAEDTPGPGLSILKVSWSGRGSYTNAVPAKAGDVRRHRAIVFRAALDVTDPRNPKGRAQNLRVRITDSRGRTASVAAGPYAAALGYPPPTSGEESTPFLLNQVRVPLSAFTGVDLRHVRAVSLDFGTTPKGSIGLTDLSFG